MNANDRSATECRCPTCGAAQAWSDECRRCGTDISFLRRLADEWKSLQHQWAAALRNGNRQQAESVAERLLTISPTTFHKMLYDFLHFHDKNHG